MELLYVYEDKVAVDVEGNYYVGSAFSQEIFDRYLRHFDNIRLIMRKAPVDPSDTETLSRMNKIKGTHITVTFLPNLTESVKTYFSPEIRDIFNTTIEGCISIDKAVIIRAPAASGYVAARYCVKHHIPYLAEAVGCPWDSLINHSAKGKVLAPGARVRMEYVMANAAYAVYVTEEFLQKRYPTKGKAAAISDVELITAGKDVLDTRLNKIRMREDKLKLATAAAVNVPFKGQRYVIEALANLKARGNTNFEYHLAGGGDNTALKDLAERLGVADQVIFEGAMPHDKMFAWYDDMDLYIQPSLQEGLPRAVVEAMSRGLPCLMSDVGGMKELVSDNCRFKKQDVAMITTMLENITNGKMLEMAIANFKRAKSFDRKLLDEKRYSFYSEFAKAAEESMNNE